MADVIPFSCIRPRKDMVQEVAALPYDVFSVAEAREEIAKHPDSFLRIDLPEAVLPDPVEPGADIVYETARELLDQAIDDATYVTDAAPSYYLYRLTAADGRTQTGIVGCASIDDYQSGVIKKHEKTRADKEIDRIRHVDTCSAQTGPIFLAFRSDGTVEAVMDKVTAQQPLYDFVADDGVGHTVWQVEDSADATAIQAAFAATPALYIADGHHRTASAVKAGLLRRDQQPVAEKSQPLEADYFLSVIFPSNQLDILDYNRVVMDLNGLSAEEFLAQVAENFVTSEPQKTPTTPERKGTFGMHLDGRWYMLTAKDALLSDDPVSGLDVSILQENLLAPILGIEDPRTDNRIDFVGGIRGLAELERRVAEDAAVAFALFPTSIDELFAVADADRLMPPKSTWFEPKPRSGIFIHRI